MGYEGLKREDVTSYQCYQNDPYFEIGLSIPANNFPNPMTVRLDVLQHRCRNLAKLCGLTWTRLKFEPKIDLSDHVVRVKITVPSDPCQNQFRKEFKQAVIDATHVCLEKTADEIRAEYIEWAEISSWLDDDK